MAEQRRIEPFCGRALERDDFSNGNFSLRNGGPFDFENVLILRIAQIRRLGHRVIAPRPPATPRPYLSSGNPPALVLAAYGPIA